MRKNNVMRFLATSINNKIIVIQVSFNKIEVEFSFNQMKTENKYV